MKNYRLFLYLAALGFITEGIQNIYATYNNTTIQPSLTLGVCYLIVAAVFVFILKKEK